MKKTVLAFSAFLLVCPILANAQTYYLPYYEQRELTPLPTTPYFLENRTGAPLFVTLRVKFLGGREELWFFNVEPEKEVFANIPNGGVQVSVSYAEVSVPKGNKIETRRALGQLYERQERSGEVSTGWWFYKK